MASKTELYRRWVLEALQRLNGRAKVLDVAKEIWRLHEADLRREGDMFYQWQYQYRWGQTVLRKEGLMKRKEDSPKGIWELTPDGKEAGLD